MTTPVRVRQNGRQGLRALLTLLIGVLVAAATAASAADLTIEIEGDLLRHGGVVTVHPIPTPETDIAGEFPTKPVRISARYAEVQMRYPSGSKHVFRFRAAQGEPQAHLFKTQPLSVMGIDAQGRSTQMKVGFEGAYSSGGQIIRVLPRNEWGGSDDATRTAARWGKTEAYTDPPPADHRSARALLGVVVDTHRPEPLGCDGDGSVMVCTIAADRWPAVEALWWRAIAEQRLERLHDYALRRCYDSQWFRTKTCEPQPETDEPSYR